MGEWLVAGKKEVLVEKGSFSEAMIWEIEIC